MRQNSLQIAVVIPLHNKQASIVRAVSCAFAQTYQPLTVVVVDDGSTDESIVRLAESGLLPRIRLVQQDQHGPGPARNAGWSACDADWIAFLDADDAWKSTHLASLASAVQAFPHVEWAATTREVDWGSSRRALMSLRHSFSIKLDEKPRVRLADYFSLAIDGEILPHSSSTMVRKSALEAVGGFPDALPSEDIALWCVLALRGDVAYSSARTVTVAKDGANITERLRSDARTSDHIDAMAVRRRPDVAVIDAVRNSRSLDEDVRYRAERYADFLLTRHWVTTILDASQPLAQESLELIRHRRGHQFRLFLLVSRIPAWLARPTGQVLSAVVRKLGFEKPVSPFIDRGWQRRNFRTWLERAVGSLR